MTLFLLISLGSVHLNLYVFGLLNLLPASPDDGQHEARERLQLLLPPVRESLHGEMVHDEPGAGVEDDGGVVGLPEDAELQGIILSKALKDLGAGVVHKIIHLVLVGEDQQLLTATLFSLPWTPNIPSPASLASVETLEPIASVSPGPTIQPCTLLRRENSVTS